MQHTCNSFSLFFHSIFRSIYWSHWNNKTVTSDLHTAIGTMSYRWSQPEVAKILSSPRSAISPIPACPSNFFFGVYTFCLRARQPHQKRIKKEEKQTNNNNNNNNKIGQNHINVLYQKKSMNKNMSFSCTYCRLFFPQNTTSQVWWSLEYYFDYLSTIERKECKLPISRTWNTS